MKPVYNSKYTNSWALIVGINKYEHVAPLEYATNDAKGVARILEDRFAFPKENVTLLLNEKATREAIRKSFLEYANTSKIQADDRLLVFFAGHGHTITGTRGEVGLLVPVDGKPEDLNTLIRWDDLTRNADLVPAKHIFFLMDACYGGLALLRSPAFGSMRFLGDMLQRSARQVLTAGKANETVADGNGIRPGHSVFTAHLIDALEGSAATQDGVITANGVMAYVYDRVARDQYSHQTPHYGFLDGDGDFIFDASSLDRLRTLNGSASEKGTKDLLVNTSPEIVTAVSTDTPVVDAVKDLLSDPSKKIKLDDFVSSHIRVFLDQVDLRHFPVQGTVVTKEAFIERLDRYEELSKDLQQIAILLAKWGEGSQLLLLEKIFTRIAESDKGAGGVVLWLKLSWYPVLLIMYSSGIAALSAHNYDALRIAIATPVQVETRKTRVPIEVPVISQLTEIYEAFKWLSGRERQYVPRSEHLFTTLQPVLEDMLLLGRSYEPLFDDFEILLALTFADSSGRDWGPPGRFGWKHSSRDISPFKELVLEAQRKKDQWGPIRAGLFDGSFERFSKTAESYAQLLSGLNWF